jgi:enolase-phosphatase E1
VSGNAGSPSLPGAGVRIVLLDIEGTTTPIAFVHDVLFPFARDRVRSWLAARPSSDPERLEVVEGLRAEQAADPEWQQSDAHAGGTIDEELDATVSYVHWLMDRDRKSRALKILQGRIWQDGYQRGELKGEVYPDVPAALVRWRTAGLDAGIFSSGSVLAQKLLFAHSGAGDLTPLLRWHFDTAVGAKIEAASYRRIVAAAGAEPAQVLFISDVVKELDAAREAGLQTLLCVRPPAVPPLAATHPIVHTLDELR